MQQMLDVVGKALKAAGVDAVRHSENEKAAEVRAEERRREEIRRRRSILAGTWHDPRADCLAGNGIMSELGVGDELFRPEDGDSVDEVHAFSEGDLAYSEKSHVKSAPETQVNQGKPIVVIKNFATKRGQDVIIAELAKWAASLVQGGVAHVIVVSDNRENAKVLAQGEYSIQHEPAKFYMSVFSAALKTPSCHRTVGCRLIKRTCLRRAEALRNKRHRKDLI